MDAEELVCERDGVATRLRCAECAAGICPACLVRTPVGHKCPSCAGERAGARRRSPLPLLVAGVAVAALLVGVLLTRPSTDSTAPDPVALQTDDAEVTQTRQAMIGEEARDGQLTFVVEEFTCQPERIAGWAVSRSPGGKLCLLRMNVRNISGSPAVLLGRFQYLVDGQSRTYGPDEGLSRGLPENANRSLDELNVNPDVTVPVGLLFDIPSTVDPVEAQFKGTGRSRFGINVRLERRAA